MKKIKEKLSTLDYHKKYSLYNLILLFFIFSMVGWLWEVILHIFSDGMFVNRGVLLGPWLPIYGSGGILIILITKRWLDRPFVTFGVIVVTCAVIEYATSWYLETFKGAKWWDYSDLPLNLHGRICLEGLLIFGIGGCIFLYLAAPKLDALLNRIPKTIKTVVCLILIAIFVVDFIHSIDHPNMGQGITAAQLIAKL